MSESTNREKKIVVAGIWGIVMNALLVAFKAMIGWATGSIAIVTDAVNNLTDALSSVITIVGAKLAARAADHGHPFGHGRIEYISAILIAVLILYAGVSAFVDSVEKIITPDTPRYDIVAIMIMIVSIAIKILLGLYYRHTAKKTDSQALAASGTDAMYDALISSSILISMAILYMGKINIDGWLGVLIAAFIIKSGIDVLIENGNRLIGERIPREVSVALKQEIAAFPGVLGAYDLIVSRYGPDISIGSVHVGIPDWMSAHEIDTLSRRISTAMYKRHGLIMTVGIYAANQSSPIAREMHAYLEDFVQSHPEILQVHGFYVDEPSRQVSFDIIVDFQSKNRRKVEKEIQEKMKAKYPEYTFHTVLDRDISD